MRFLFWRRQKEKPKPTLASVLESFESSRIADERAKDTVRGAELLEQSHLEPDDLGPLAKLPPFSPVVISLMRLFDREDVKSEEIARLVSADPALTSELLGVVNSPMFAFQKKVSSPAHAVSLLGVERTKSLAATLAMRSMMQGAPRTPVVRRFWVHSIATATIAKQFASSFGADPELSHVSATMHDLGRLGLVAAHAADYTKLALASHDSVEEILAAEQAQFGMTHCQAGARLAKSWSLPEPFGKVANHHHDSSSDQPIVGPDST